MQPSTTATHRAATVRAPCQHVADAPRADATEYARRQPIARSTGALRPLKFLTTGH